MRTTELTIHTGRRRGIFDITDQCRRFVAEATADADGPARDGLLNVFVPHATCGVVVMELGSGSEEDLLAALDRLLPRDDRYAHRHGTTGHGADHVIPAFLSPSMTAPIVGGRLAIGAWQSIALVDTNVDNEVRRVVLTLG
jgi:secondary thiamine-phosphate synthase enzyme